MPAFLFPGQGSQQAGTTLLFQNSCAQAGALMTQAAQILSEREMEAVLHGSQEALFDTRHAQPALFCASSAIAVFLTSLGVRPSLCAGYSMGEIPALVSSGALAFEPALKLIRERARLMSLKVPEGGMAAVLGLPPEQIAALLPDTVQIAAYTGATQTTISGTKAGLAVAAPVLKEAGAKRIVPLSVSGPFHSRHMETAAQALAQYLSTVPLHSPSLPFLSSVSGVFEEDPEHIRKLLAEQLYRPVHWTAVMETLADREAVEIGPGNILQGFVNHHLDRKPVLYGADTPQRCVELAGMLE